MRNRIFIGLMLVLPALLSAELIHTSQLKEQNRKFSLSRNLFFPASAPAAKTPSTVPQAESQEIKKTLQEEIAQSVKYVGYSNNDNKITAILNVSGEYHYVQEGDLILDKIKIIKITKEAVTLEYENQTFEIRRDKENENVQTSDK